MNASLSVDDRKVLLRSTEAKSHAANGVNQRIGLAAVDFAAHPPDIDVDDIGRWVEVEIPDMLQQHRAGNHFADIANQVLEKLKFPRQQLDLAAAPADDPHQQVDLQVADAQDGFLYHRSAAAGERIDPRQHLPRRKWLDQVVVATGAQPADAVIDFAERAQDQRRGHYPFVPQATYDLDPIDPRQHAVNGHHNIIGRAGAFQSIFAIRCEIDAVATCLQTIDQLLSGLRVVFDHENVSRTDHRSRPSRSPLRASIRFVSLGKVTFKSEINL